jgi:uncharacterized protein
MPLEVARNSKRKNISSKIVYHISHLSQATGLQFHKKIVDEVHIFPFSSERKVPLTMWFVFFSIDVLYLDKNKKIVEMKENFKPFTNYFPKQISAFVIELPAGTIKEHKLELNEKMVF